MNLIERTAMELFESDHPGKHWWSESRSQRRRYFVVAWTKLWNEEKRGLIRAFSVGDPNG